VAIDRGTSEQMIHHPQFSSRKSHDDAPTSRAPLMIVGCPRSGTTFLAHMINRFLDIHVARDAGVFLRFNRELPSYGDLSQRANMKRLIDDLYKDAMFRKRFLERGLALNQADLCEAVREPSYVSLVRQVFVETARAHGKSYWGNKKPSYALRLADTEAIFPEAKTIHIIRDARDVVLSMRRSSNLLVEKNWYFAASDWVEHVALARRAGEILGPRRYLEIKYENLLTEPIAVFERLLEFIEADDAGAQLEKVREGIHGKVRAGNYDKWRTEMPERAIRVVERVAGDLLADLGYQVQFPADAGRGFNKAQVGLFSVDRVIRNLFTRDSKQFISSHYNELATAGRARLGALLGRRTAAAVSSKVVADRNQQ